MRTALLTHQSTWVDGRTAAPPLPREGMTLGALLERFAAKLDGPAGTLVLADSWPELLDSPEADGWHWSTIREWTRFTPKAPDGQKQEDQGPEILVADGRKLTAERLPVQGTELFETATYLDIWHRSTARDYFPGCPWRGTAGASGIALQRALGKHRRQEPRWSWTGGPDVGHGEIDYDASQWEAPGRSGRYRHTFDLNQMYLGAFLVLEVSRDALKRTGRRDFDPSLAGWWKVEFEPWHLEELLPDPAGYPFDRTDTGPRWVTSQTLALVHSLTQKALPDGRPWHLGYTVLDSWTGPGTRVWRQWAEIIRDISYFQADMRDPVKWVYKKTFGMLLHEKSRIKRADWHHAVIAQARANLWRKLQKAGTADGCWPVSVGPTDEVTYASDSPRPEAPASFTVDQTGVQLGAWKAKHRTDTSTGEVTKWPTK